MRDLTDLLVLSGPLFDLDSVGSTTMRDATFFSEWLASGPRSSLSSAAKRSLSSSEDKLASPQYESVVFPAFERAAQRWNHPENEPESQLFDRERSSLDAMIDSMPVRLPIVLDSRVPIGGGRSIMTSLSSPLNALGSALVTSLEQVPDALLDRVAFVPIGPFTEYYVADRSGGELVLRDPFSEQAVHRGSRSAIRGLMRSPERAELFSRSLGETVFPGYLFDASSAGAWSDVFGRDRRPLQMEGYVGEAIAARRLAHVLECSWRALDGDFGFRGLPVFARSAGSVRRTLKRALDDVERNEGVRIPIADRESSLFEGSDRGMLDEKVQKKIVSMIGSLDPSAPLERRIDPLCEPILSAYGIPLVVEPWSRIIERSIEQPVSLTDGDGTIIGVGALRDALVPISSLAGSESVFSLFVEGNGGSDVSASVIGLGMCPLRHVVGSAGVVNPIRDASIAIHRALALPPFDPSVSYRFSTGYTEVPFVATRNGVRIGYRPDFAALVSCGGSYDLFIADAKVTPFSARPREGQRDQILVYGSLLGSDLRDAGVLIGSVHAQVYSLPERGVSDVFEPSARLIFDPYDPKAVDRVSFLARLPSLKRAHADPQVRERTKRISESDGSCIICRQAFSDRYERCGELLKGS